MLIETETRQTGERLHQAGSSGKVADIRESIPYVMGLIWIVV